MAPDEKPEYDTNILHAARDRLRRELLIDPPWTEIILVRHAQQSFSDEDLAAGGAAGPRLSDTGERQAELTAAALTDRPLAAVYASQLTRAQATAEAITRNRGDVPAPKIDRDLREIEVDGEVTEDSAVVRERLARALTGIVTAHPGRTVAAVSHGGAISAFVASLLDVEPDIFFFAAHASITRVRYDDGRWAVQSINETAHLGDLITH